MKSLRSPEKSVSSQHNASPQSPDDAAKNTQKINSRHTFLRILSYSTRLDKACMIVATLCSLGTGAALPLMIAVFGRLVGIFNSYFEPGSTVSQVGFRSSVSHNALYIFCIFIGKFVLDYISIYAFRMTGIRISGAVRMAYLTALFNEPISAIDKLSPGAAMDALTTVANTIQLAISDKLGSLTQGIGLIIAAYVVAFTHSWSLTLVSSSMVLFVCIVSGTTAPLFFKYDKLVRESSSQASAVAGEALQGIRTVKSLSAEDHFTRRHGRWVDEARERGLTKSLWVAVSYWPSFFSNYANMALTFWFGVKLYARHDIDGAGTVITVLFCVLLVTVGIAYMFLPLQNISKASAAAVACFKVIDAPQLKHGGLADLDVRTLGDVSFENVTFSYPSRPQAAILQDLSFTIPHGKVTAFVGQSGCGKSTIVALLERWYDLSEVNAVPPKSEGQSGTEQGAEKDVAKYHTAELANVQCEQGDSVVFQNSGRIACGSHNIETFDRKWWRSHIGLVQQEPVLFNETIFENVCKGLVGSRREEASISSKLELVKEACREAFANEFIGRLPHGYDTVVGERGVKLSGGQRQRLAIARAIIKRPEILILDEATSSIDVHGEQLVTAALERVSKGRTTVVIAHRLSTIRKADHIVVLKQGTAAEEGTHTELLARRDGIYTGLVQAQRLQLDAADGDSALPLERDLLLDSHVAEPENIFKDDDTSSDSKAGLLRSICSIIYEQRHHRVFYTLTVAAAIGAGAAYPLQAYFFSHIVVVFQSTGAQLVSRANFWALMLFILALCVGLCYGIIGYTTSALSTHVNTGYRQQYFENTLHKPIAWFDEKDRSVGTLAGQLSADPQRLEELLGPNMAFPLIAIFSLIGCTAIGFAFGWKLTLVVFFAALPVILGAGFVRMRYEMSFEEMNAKVFAESSQFAAESIAAFRTVTALTLEETILQRYRQLLQRHIREAFLKGRVSVLVFSLSDSLDLCAMALAFWYGGQLLATREYDVLQFIVIYAAVVQGGQASGQFLAVGPNIARAIAAANRILASSDCLEMQNSDQLMSQQSESRDEGTEVDFLDVGFTYASRQTPVYRHLTLKIYRGEYVAFVGPSGCGKTTIVSLLQQFYTVSSGRILIDGTDIRNIPIAHYRSLCGLVSQEPMIFDGTVRENLILGLPVGSASEEAIIEACQQAEIHSFLASLPQGYDTPLAAGTHASLSGGQKQRLCIARALLRQPRLLLLDEATNSLDSVSEGLIQRAIERVAAEKKTTVVVVAHRVATVQNADRIVVMGEGGVVLEQGTHVELLRRKGPYHGMCEAQALDR